VRPLWHPLATVFLTDPPGYATERLLRMLLRSGSLRVRYAGDRMWPAVGHGEVVEVRPPGAPPAPGDVVLASLDGVPDLLRVESARPGRLALAADADPGTSAEVASAAIVGVVGRPRRRDLPGARWVRRLVLELREAWQGRCDDRRRPAGTVLRKYDEQATFYADVEGDGLEPALTAALRERSAGCAVLVVGSGTGRECFGLAREGYRVLGVDFAPGMVTLARRAATARGLDVEFRQGDVREFDPGARRFSAIVFTHDVYSFVPGRDERIRLLRRMAAWLEAGGVVLISARRAGSLHERLLLSVQWLSALRAGDKPEWGASHTRWVAADGNLRRSFVQVFSPARLLREFAAAGFVVRGRAGGHWVLEAVRAAAAANMAP